MRVPVGVPQGSILDPLNALPQCLTSCKVTLYADDTLIYYSSPSLNEVECKLNVDLANVTDWFNKILLTLNFEKSKLLHFGRSRRLKSCGSIKFIVQGHQIKQSNNSKYLGITIHENVTWSDYVKALSIKITSALVC